MFGATTDWAPAPMGRGAMLAKKAREASSGPRSDGPKDAGEENHGRGARYARARAALRLVRLDHTVDLRHMTSVELQMAPAPRVRVATDDGGAVHLQFADGRGGMLFRNALRLALWRHVPGGASATWSAEWSEPLVSNAPRAELEAQHAKQEDEAAAERTQSTVLT